jgi:hypothetical protein
LSGLSNLRQFHVEFNLLTGGIPAAPPSLISASLCPNPLDTTPQPNIDSAWNQAAGFTPWWAQPFATNRCDDLFYSNLDM